MSGITILTPAHGLAVLDLALAVVLALPAHRALTGVLVLLAAVAARESERTQAQRLQRVEVVVDLVPAQDARASILALRVRARGRRRGAQFARPACNAPNTALSHPVCTSRPPPPCSWAWPRPCNSAPCPARPGPRTPRPRPPIRIARPCSPSRTRTAPPVRPSCTRRSGTRACSPCESCSCRCDR